MATETIQFNFHWQPKQNELIQMYENTDATKIGFGGSRGGTKSHTADDLMILRRLKYPKTSGLLVMRVLDDVKDIHIRPMLARYPYLNDWYHKQDKLITFPNGSFIRFISVENFSELQKKAGRGFADIMIDQSELFTQDELEFLGTINRHVPVDANDNTESLDIIPKMLFTFNPGGVGHAYHKRIFIEKQYEENEEPNDYAFLQAYGWDNAFWCISSLKRDGFTVDDFHTWGDEKRFDYFIKKSEYGRKLNRLPDSKRKAQLLGSFDVFEGQFFSVFRRNHHLIPYQFRNEFNTMGGIDYGNITVLEIVQADYEGTIAAADELYLNDDVETPSERAELIADFLTDRNLNKITIMCDTDMDIAQVSNVGYKKKPIDIFRETLKEKMGENAPVLVIVNKKPLDNNKQYRGSINDAVMDYLRIRIDKDENKYSKMYLSDKNVPWLVRSLAELIHPQNSPNGLDYDNTHPMRHQFDAFKYAFQMLWSPPKKSHLTAKEKWELQRKQVDQMMAQTQDTPYDARRDW